MPAKLARPQATEALARPRLFRAIERDARVPVTWLHAPAGAGKTLLLGSYLSARREPVVWYTLDVADRDLSGFFHYARLAVEQLVGRPVLVAKYQAASPEALRAFTRRFFEALFAELPEGACWAFDDFHEVGSDPGWSVLFRELVAVVPAHLRIFVASRIAPPRALARSISTGRIGTLGWDQLRFSPAEARRLLRHHGLRLPGHEKGKLIEQIVAQCSGWAVAISLFAGNADGEPARDRTRLPPSTAARGTGGKFERVFDFLASEIFEQLDAAAREFLLGICLFPSFNLAQAAALSGSGDGADLLGRLLRESLLIEAYGDGRFRLHDLFRTFLLERVQRSLPLDQRRALFARAGSLLASEDQFQAAAEWLAAAEDWGSLAALLKEHAPTIAARGQLATLRAALERMPEPEREADPWVMYWESVARLSAPTPSAQSLAERAFQRFEARSDATGVCLAWALAVQWIVRTGLDFAPLEAWLKKRASLPLSRVNRETAAQVAVSELLALSYWDPGSARALEATRHALQFLHASDRFDEQTLMTWCMTMMVYSLVGHRQAATRLHRVLREYLETRLHEPLVKLVSLYFEAMLNSWLSNDLDGASRATREALALGRWSGVELLDSHLHFQGVQVALCRGDLSGARALLAPMRHLAASGPPAVLGPCAYVSGWEAFERDDLDNAEHWLGESLGAAERLPARIPRAISLAGLVICAGARKDADLVRRRIEQLAPAVRDAGVRAIDAAQALATTYARVQLGTASDEEVETAVRLVAEEGLGPLILFTQRVLKCLFVAALQRNIEVTRTQQLIRACAIRAGAEASLLPQWPWPIRVFALGRLELEVDGKRVQFGRKTPHVLLALLELLASQDAPLPTERILRALWPGYGDRGPRGTLDTAVYRLRKLLGNDAAVEHSGKSLALCASLCWTDVNLLNSVCRRVGSLARGPTPPASADLEHCERLLLGVYRATPTTADLPPLARARGRLRRRWAAALSELGQLWQRAGHPARREALLHAASPDDSGIPNR